MLSLNDERRTPHALERVLVRGTRPVRWRYRVPEECERVGRVDRGEERAHATTEAATHERDLLVVGARSASRAARRSSSSERGSVSLLITGDEEGPSINGTDKLLRWAAGKGERWDGAVVGEPTNPERLGDMIKTGRRGSLSGIVTVLGRQGHVAYPHLADNPVHAAVALADALIAEPFDHGTADFQPSNLEITSIDVGNPSANVIPARATVAFNIRFNDSWTAESLQSEIHDRLDRAATARRLPGGEASPIEFELAWRARVSHVFLTRDERLVGLLAGSIQAVTGRRPKLSTSGGTSDARFIKDYCPVVDFGLVGQTMHMVDERVALTDLEVLTQIYERFLEDWFG